MKARTSTWGRPFMNPTVSVTMMFLRSGYLMSLVVGFRVLKGLSSVSTLLLVRRLRRVDFPELV